MAVDLIVTGWLIWAYWPFETVFQSISGRLPDRGSKKREMIDERKKSPNKPHPHLLQALNYGPLKLFL